MGITLGALRLDETGVEITSLRRGRDRLVITDELVIQANDVIVMRGASEALAVAEETLSGARNS